MMLSCKKPALSGELVVDNFAGGGGASTGIAWAIGRDPDYAINHDDTALKMHAENHPDSVHICEDIWAVDPRKIAKDQPIGLAWFSPDCKHHSRAKGGRPVEKKIRALAWVVIKWARTVRPRVIMLENVREFREWGPLKDDRPDKSRMGETYRSWRRHLTDLGYDVEERDLNAADYGAPTHRRRLFLIARCDGLPIIWSKPTHGEGLLPYATAAECIDWSIPTNSIFGRKRPLAENTMRRIYKGLQKFVFDDPEPFIVRTGHYKKGQPVYFRGQPLTDPLGTVVAHTAEKALIVPHISQFYGGMVGKSLGDPLPTITSWDHNALVAAHVSRFYGTGVGSNRGEPLRTITAQGNKFAEVAAFLSQYNGQSIGAAPDKPPPTVMSMNKLATVQADVNGAHDNTELVRAFLIKYYGIATGQKASEPLHTITTKARLGIITINGADYQITDIGLRMLQPRELARAQGFPDSYTLTGTKANQIDKIGNSVCPVLAQRLVESNLMEPMEMEGVIVA